MSDRLELVEYSLPATFEVAWQPPPITNDAAAVILQKQARGFATRRYTAQRPAQQTMLSTPSSTIGRNGNGTDDASQLQEPSSHYAPQHKVKDDGAPAAGTPQHFKVKTLLHDFGAAEEASLELSHRHLANLAPPISTKEAMQRRLEQGQVSPYCSTNTSRHTTWSAAGERWPLSSPGPSPLKNPAKRNNTAPSARVGSERLEGRSCGSELEWKR